MAEGRSWFEGDLLHFEIDVVDTDVRAVPAFYWEGSAVEIGLKEVSSSTPGCCHYVLLPDGPKPSVLLNGQLHPPAKSSLHLDKTGYRISFALDLREVGIAGHQPFLWELVFHVNALGTAHGKLRSAWQGSENLTADQSRFALVVPV